MKCAHSLSYLFNYLRNLTATANTFQNETNENFYFDSKLFLLQQVNELIMTTCENVNVLPRV